MINVGVYNELELLRFTSVGAYLGSGDFEVLLPTKWIPEDSRVGDVLEVFVYRDSEDRLIATTIKPYAIAGDFAFLECRQVNSMGAFMDWGMEKDLLVPFREQSDKIQEGRSYVVFVYTDEVSDRLIGSSRLNKFFEKDEIRLETGDIVDLLVFSETPKGFNAVVNNLYQGLIYRNEIFEQIRVGDRMRGYVKQVREDNKIDLSLQKSGFAHVDETVWRIVSQLKENNGFLPLNDDSSPEEIKNRLQISKKAFKKAVGGLYKSGRISLEGNGIRLKDHS